MRRMREWSWSYLLLAVPVLAVGFGVRYFVHQQHGTAARSTSSVSSGQTVVDSDSFSETLDDPEREQQPRRANSAKGAGDASASAATSCRSVEYRGFGPEYTHITPKEWTRTLTLFGGVKRDLLAWLERKRGDLPKETYGLLRKQMEGVQLQRPPSAAEPDLAWRGIGVTGMNAKNQAWVRLGGGFTRFIRFEPQRARFELARLVAQTWAPCELQKLGNAPGPWQPLLSCLKIDEQKGCGTGSYSESGWAVSTAIASVVSDPGCRIPAFEDQASMACVQNFPIASAATAEHRDLNEWQEARR